MAKVHPARDDDAGGAEAGGTPGFRVLNATPGSALHHLKERVQCFFEGGRRACRHCGPGAARRNARRNGSCAIDGLNSNWIVPGSLMAMARPGEAALAAGLLARLREGNVRAIVNLQEIGEHAHCGAGILRRSGLSYLPETVMAQGIHHFNPAWRDMAAPRVEMAADIVRVMHEHVSAGGAVAVHCHAGLGRTGLIIACYLIFYHRMRAADAVAEVRRHRRGSVQNRRQEAFTRAFEEAVLGARAVTPSLAAGGGAPSASMPALVARQRLLHAGASFTRYYWVLECLDSSIAALAARADAGERVAEMAARPSDEEDDLLDGELARAVDAGPLEEAGRYEPAALLRFMRALFRRCAPMLPDSAVSELVAASTQGNGSPSGDDDESAGSIVAASLLDGGGRADRTAAASCPRRACVVGIVGSCVAAAGSPSSAVSLDTLLTLLSKLLILNSAAPACPIRGGAWPPADRRLPILRIALRRVADSLAADAAAARAPCMDLQE